MFTEALAPATQRMRRNTIAADPSESLRPAKSAMGMGHMTWFEPHIEQYRARHLLGTARWRVPLLD